MRTNRDLPSGRFWALVLTVAMVSPATGSFVQVDDFESFTLGEADGQGGWDVRSGSVSVVLDPAGGANQVLAVTTDSVRLHRPLVIGGSESRTLFLRFRVSDKQNYSLGLSPLSVPTEFSDFGPEIGMSNAELDLRCWNGDEQYEELATLVPDQWYNLWVHIDAATETYRIWLNSAPGASADPVADQLTSSEGDALFNFRAGVGTGLRNFFIKTGGGNSSVNSGPLYLDDLFIENRAGLNLSNPLVHPGPEITLLHYDPSAQELELTWTSTEQRSYRITGSATLDDGFPAVLANGIVGEAASATTTALVVTPGDTAYFVRVEEE